MQHSTLSRTTNGIVNQKMSNTETYNVVVNDGDQAKSNKKLKKFKDMKSHHSEFIDGILADPSWIPKFVEEFCVVNPDKREEVTKDYREWLDIAVAWRNDRKNPVLSFLFLDGHPAFWKFKNQPTEGQSFNDFLKGNDLITRGVSSLWKYVDSQSPYMLETGNAVPPYRLSRYHDYDLDSFGKSFEECFAKTAKATFGLNGFAVVNIE